MNFFGHDSNASNDPRIKKLLARYGFEGTGLYWHMVELITRHLDPPREQSCELQEDNETLAYAGRLEVKKCAEIVKFMLELGLFTLSESKKIMNSKVLRRLSDAQKRKIRRTNDGQQPDNDRQETDNGRCEVNRSEVEVKGIEKNRSEDENPLNKGEVNKTQIILNKISEYHEMLQNPKYGDDQRALFKAEIKRLERSIQL